MRKLSPAEVLAREAAKAKREKLELAMALQLRAHKIPYLGQYLFCNKRKWRFDFAIFKPIMLAIEVQGGIYTGGRHTRGDGIERECEKMAHAIIAGWMVMPVTAKQIKSGAAIDWIQRALRSLQSDD